MREQVLWRKVARIIMRLAERLQISPERALAIFYDTRTCSMLHDSKYGLHLMSDDYILNDLLRELGDRQWVLTLLDHNSGYPMQSHGALAHVKIRINFLQNSV